MERKKFLKYKQKSIDISKIATYYIIKQLLKQQHERSECMNTVNLDFIKTKRIQRKISMQKMAELLGFKNASTYLKYENGIYAFKAEQLPKLAEILDCSITDFFTKNVAKTAI